MEVSTLGTCLWGTADLLAYETTPGKNTVARKLPTSDSHILGILQSSPGVADNGMYRESWESLTQVLVNFTDKQTPSSSPVSPI